MSELQWGHALSSVETERSKLQLSELDKASMGPRSLKRGNRSGSGFASDRSISFNGATLSQAWKRIARDITRVMQKSFNGATLSQAWKPDTNGGDEERMKGFNGATLSQAWKRVMRSARWKSSSSLQWGHALSSVETIQDH